MNETINTILSRKTCRKFDRSKDLSRQDLEVIIKAAQSAPSACNCQSAYFTVIQNPAVLNELNSVVFDVLDNASKQRIQSRTEGKEFNFFYFAKALIIVSNSNDSLYPEADSACALQNMMLAATSLNIGSCWINQLTGRSDEKKIREFLTKIGVSEKNKVYGCLALGYPLENTEPKIKRTDTANYI